MTSPRAVGPNEGHLGAGVVLSKPAEETEEAATAGI